MVAKAGLTIEIFINDGVSTKIVIPITTALSKVHSEVKIKAIMITTLSGVGIFGIAIPYRQLAVITSSIPKACRQARILALRLAKC